MSSPAPDGAGDGLRERTLGAARWQSASAMVQGGLQFGVGILLARLLRPEDFGLVALVLVVAGLTTLVADLGLGPAIVQRRPLEERHLRAALAAAVAVALVAAGAVWLLAPLLERLLRVAGLAPVLRLAALGFPLAALGSTGRALLRRRLDFRRLFRVEAASYLAGYAGVATTLALLGFGASSLVWGSLAQGLLGSVLAVHAARPPLRPLLARRELGELLGFGTGVSLNALANFAARNVDNLVAGRWLGAGMLGLYARAYNLMVIPLTYVSSVTGSILFPALSEIQDDRARIGRAYLASVRVVALVVAPVMAGMVVAAPHLVVGLYGEKWAGAVAPLQVLCAVGLFRSVYDAAAAVTHASGRVWSELLRQGAYALLVAAACLAGVRWGPAGVAAGVALAVVAMYLMMAQLALRIVGCRWRDFARAQLPGVAAAAGVGASALLARLALERAGAGPLLCLLGILAACALSLPLALSWLPGSLRPAELTGGLAAAVARLPVPVRPTLMGILRLPPLRETV